MKLLYIMVTLVKCINVKYSPKGGINMYRLLITTIGLLILCMSVNAQDTLKFNYQGYLTDSDGNPITGDVQMTFKIYDGSGVMLWSCAPEDVTVANGLFTKLIEWADWPTDTEGNPYGDYYLGITVGEDPEISPRTLLASAPSAGVSKRVHGDIETMPGILEIHPPDPCVPPDPCEPSIKLAAEPDKSIIRLHPPEPCVPPEPCDPAFEVEAVPGANAIKLYSPNSSSTEPSTYIEAGPLSVDFDLKINVGPDDVVNPISMGSNWETQSSHLSVVSPSETAETEISIESSADKSEIGIESKIDHLKEFYVSHENLLAANVMGIRSPDRHGAFDETSYNIGAFVADSKSSINVDYVMPTDGESSAIKLEVDALKSFLELRHNDEFGESDPHEVKIVAKPDTGLIMVGGPPPDDGVPSVEVKSTPAMASIVLEGNDPTGAPPQIAIVAGATDAQVGIGTDTPAEALDVVGTTQTNGFKMPTGASDGYVLTSDADGNGTWQAAASGGIVNIVSESVVNTTHSSDGTFDVTFPAFSFSDAPDVIHCSVVLREAGGPLQGGMVAHANISDITSTGFSVEVVDQKGSSTTVNDTQVTLYYLAIQLD
jgi:hypothetical protein